MAKFNGKLLLLFIACLFALSQAVPMEDISETDVDITESEISPTKESFLVDVMRTDLLVSDDGELLGERLQCVMIEFELDDDQLLINNVPVALGVTSISVIEAQIIESPTNQTLTDEEIEELEDDFDIGLVTVELTTSAESYPSEDPSISLRVIKFSISIIEIDGIDIVQTDAIEKFLEVKTLNDDSGDLTWPSSVATDTADMTTSSTDNYDDANPHAPCTFDTFLARLKHWWKCSSSFTRVLITSFVLTSISGILFALVHALMVVIRQRRGVYQQVAANEDDEYASPKNEQVIYVADEEKRALMVNQDKN